MNTPSDQQSPDVSIQASLYCQFITGQDNPIINVLYMHEGADLTMNGSTSPETTPLSDPDYTPYSVYNTADKVLLDAYARQQENLTPHMLLQETESGKGNKNAITSCRVWVLDIDTPESPERVQQLAALLPPSFIVASSPGKYHFYYCTARHERFASSTDATRPEDRFHYWIEVQKALLAAALHHGFDVDCNYTQITKRCRIPGFIRAIKRKDTGAGHESNGTGTQLERYIPRIIWASGRGDKDTITRWTRDQMVAWFDNNQETLQLTYSEAVSAFDSEMARRKEDRRLKSRALVAEHIKKGGYSVPTSAGEFDFSHIRSADALLNPDVLSLSYPAPESGERNTILFRFMYCLTVHSAELLGQLGQLEVSPFDNDYEWQDALIEAGIECDHKHESPLGDEEVERTCLSAFEYGMKTVAENIKRRQENRNTAASTPLPESAAEQAREYQKKYRYTGYSQSGRAFDFDRSTIDPQAPYSEEALADRMLQIYGDRVNRVGKEKTQMAVFNGCKWVFDRQQVKNALYTYYRILVAEVPFEPEFDRHTQDKDGNPSATKREKLLTSLGSYMKFERVVSALKSSERIKTLSPEEFVEAPDTLAVQNGVLHLGTGELVGHSPEFFNTTIAGVQFDASATCPMWEQFLVSVFGDDERGLKVRDYMQRLCGYLVSGHMNEQVMVLLLGGGSNGKSVLTKTLLRMMGSYAAGADENDFGAGKKNGIGSGKMSERVMAKFIGKRLVLGSEFGKGVKLREEAVKRITAGEVCPARFLYGESFDVQPTFKLLIGTNHLPSVEDDSIGTWRRIHILPFEYAFLSEAEKRTLGMNYPADRIRDRIMGLEDLLVDELPGILNWCVNGYRMWQERGLEDRPVDVEREVESARFDANMGMEVLSRAVVELTTEEREQGVVGLTVSQIVQELKRVVVEESGINPNDFDLSQRKVGQYLQGVRQLKRESVKLEQGRVVKVYRVKLDFDRVPQLAQ